MPVGVRLHCDVAICFAYTPWKRGVHVVDRAVNILPSFPRCIHMVSNAEVSEILSVLDRKLISAVIA